MKQTSPSDFDVHPVILCGGSGSRLWPLSRAALPKQFVKLVSEHSMLQDTILGVSPDHGYRAPVIVSNEAFRFHVAAQTREIDVVPEAVILEPQSRNTAAAIALAALELTGQAADACMLVLPSDHVIEDRRAFHEAVRRAHELARGGALVTFGLRPVRPETGYGYIREGEPLGNDGVSFRVERFLEKPDHETATRFLDEGGYHWNSGMFMFSARRYLEELHRHRPSVLEDCEAAYAAGRWDGAFFLPDADLFAAVENISVDYAVMEHTDAAAMVAADLGWSDVGSWAAIADLGDADETGNVIDGDAVLVDCRNTYVRSGGRLVAAVGVENHVVVETPDAVLVAPRDRVQDVKAAVERLKEMERDEASIHAKVDRPWGTYQGVHHGRQHQVKHIVVRPGGKLSYQYHHHRAEHWIVVAGTAKVTLGTEVRTLGENESVFIPVRMPHRLFNPDIEPLHLIEVQYGSYLGEDDIVRLDDVYGRVAAE